MKVYVVMGNDFPECVFDNEASAKAFCDRATDENKKAIAASSGIVSHSRIHWRYYEFELRSKMP